MKLVLCAGLCCLAALGCSNETAAPPGPNPPNATDPGGSWSVLQDLPFDTQHGAAAALGDFVYVAGGYDLKQPAVATSHVLRYDPATDTWTRLNDLPEPRAQHPS